MLNVLYRGMVCDPNYLEHHGVKGQKWGVRRFQNEDGTLTEAGKSRYSKGLTDKEKQRYEKGYFFKGNSKGALKRQFNIMDNDYAEHYGKFKEHEKSFNKYANKAMSTATKKYGGLNDAAKQDKKVQKYTDKAADSLARANSENLKMKDIESYQWKKIAQARDLGYNVELKNANRSTIQRGTMRAQLLFGVIGSGAYSTYKLAKGNPLGIVGKKIKLTRQE